MAIEIEKGTLKDLSTLQKMSTETFRDTFKDHNTAEDLQNYLERAYNTEQLRTELLNTDSAFYFSYYNNELAGYLKININEAQTETNGTEFLEVEKIYIRTVFKGKGIGTALIQKATELASKYQKSKIWLGVWEQNFAAIAFYERMGFVQTSNHTFFMGDNEQTDFIMTKELKKTKE